MKLRAAVADRILGGSSLALATTLCAAMTAVSAWAEPPRATAEDRAGSPGQPAKRPGDVQKRVRELLYVLRYHRAQVRSDEWAGAIREMVQLGRPAVPEIVAELDRTDRPVTLRGLGFTLRAIGDVRAVPALVRALGKKNVEVGHDEYVHLVDPDLMAFMRKHQQAPEAIPGDFAYGIATGEIVAALEKITHRQAPEGLRGRDRQQNWEEWWAAHKEEHKDELTTRKGLDSLQVPRHARDAVEEAGIARFGPLFPTGNGTHLGPIREVELEFAGYSDARSSYIDFDKGRLYQCEEGITAAQANAADFATVMHRWERDTGVDAYCHSEVDGIDLMVWRVNNLQWDTLSAEIEAGEPLDLGREWPSWLRAHEDDQIDFRPNQAGTFLFITREGGRGVLQTFARENNDTYSRKIRYRMWVAKGAKAPPAPAPRTPRPKRDESEWGPEHVVMLPPPSRGRAFLLNLETGKRASPPDALIPAELPEEYVFADDKKLGAWCRKHGDNLGTVRTPQRELHPGVHPPPDMTYALIGLDMETVSVSPQAYEDMSLAELKELVARWPRPKNFSYIWPPRPDQAWMQLLLAPKRDTYIIATKSGALGLLQIKAAKDGLAWFRYRLDKKHAR
jgi:hypothetical protein